MTTKEFVDLVGLYAHDKWNVDDEICQQNMHRIREALKKYLRAIMAEQADAKADVKSDAGN